MKKLETTALSFLLLLFSGNSYFPQELDKNKRSQNRFLKSAFFLCFFIAFIACKEKSKGDTSDIQLPQKAIGKISEGLPLNAILIAHDKDNNYWFSSQEDGVFKFDGKTIVFYDTQDGPVSPTIIGVQEDKQGNLYFDTPEGISKFDGTSFTTLQVTELHTGKNEWKLNPDDLWFRMGWDSGPFRYDGKNLYELKLPKSPIENEFYSKHPNVSYNPYGLYSIYKSNTGDVWFGTSSMGIYRFDGTEISWMYEDQLSNRPDGGSFGFRSITEDTDGNFWINTSDFKFNILPETKKNNSIDLINYKIEPGLENTIDNTLYCLSMMTDKNEDIWMATFDRGIWKFNGTEVIHFPIKNGERHLKLAPVNTMLFDNLGDLWVATQDDGAYKFNGESFEKFYLK